MSDFDTVMERRGASRQRTFLGAKILIGSKSTYSCVIKARSETGFALKLGSTNGIPDEFVLRDECTGQSYKCEVVWRKRCGLGVKIIA